MPTAPIFLSNTLNINKHSSHSNRDVSDDYSSQLNPADDILSNNGLPSYTEIGTVGEQKDFNSTKYKEE